LAQNRLLYIHNFSNMKRFVTRTVLLILLPVLALVTVCEYFLRKIPDDYSYKNEWLTNKANTVKILVIGSSDSFFGIEPCFFSENAFNAAHVSQSIKYDHFIFTKFFNEMDSLKVLVLSVPYGSMLEFGPEKGIEDWRAKYYSIDYGCKYHRFDLKYNLEIENGLHLKNVAYSILGKINRRTCNDLGRDMDGNLKNREKNWEQTGAMAAKAQTVENIDTIIWTKNKMLIEDMINRCGQKHVYVILLTTPTYHTFRENLDPIQLDLMVESCEGFEKQHDNVCYLNLLADDRFQPDDFYDTDHLNEFGAEKLTFILQQVIDSIDLLNKGL